MGGNHAPRPAGRAISRPGRVDHQQYVRSVFDVLVWNGNLIISWDY